MKRAIPSMLVGAAALLITLAVAAMCRADVVAPPPGGTCPPGTEGGASHGMNPAYCQPKSCSNDADCTGGEVCGTLALCTDGYWAVTACPDGDECGSTGYPCADTKVCASEAEFADTEDDGSDGCSCRLGVAGSASGGGWLAVLAVGLLAARRRHACRG